MCPVLMAMGMTYDEYWNGDNYAPRLFMKADRLRRKRQNEELWLQGLYVYRAVHSLAPELNAASKEFKPEPYLDRPIPLDEKEVQEREEERIRAEAQKFAAYILGQSAKAKAVREKER